MCSSIYLAKDIGQRNGPIARGVGFAPFLKMGDIFFPLSKHRGVFQYPRIFGKSAAGWGKALRAMSVVQNEF